MNRRRDLLLALAGSVIAPGAGAQPAARPKRIGVLLVTSRETPATARILKSFEQALGELGYAEGRNLVIEWRGAEGKPERLPVLARELVALNVEVIVAGADSAGVAAKSVTDAIPIVLVASIDPVGKGLVKSFARSGTNVTGSVSLAGWTVGKQLELLRDVAPEVKRVAVIHQADDSASEEQLRAMQQASAALDMQPRVHRVKAETDLESAFQAIERERPDALLVFLTPLTFIQAKRIADFAASRRLVAVYGLTQFVEAGGLMSYAASYPEHYRRAAAYVDRLLKGAKPSDLPLQQPTKLELAVNLKTARAVGLTIPSVVLLRADRVID